MGKTLRLALHNEYRMSHLYDYRTYQMMVKFQSVLKEKYLGHRRSVRTTFKEISANQNVFEHLLLNDFHI